MKNLILATAFTFTSALGFTTASFASEDVKVTYAVEQSFIREFGMVKNVSWTETKSDMYRANFSLYEENISAFFNHDGKLVATTITKDANELPAKLRYAIERKLKAAAISEVFEMTTDEEHCYYFKATTDGKAKLYKAYSNGAIQASTIGLQ